MTSIVNILFRNKKFEKERICHTANFHTYIQSLLYFFKEFFSTKHCDINSFNLDRIITDTNIFLPYSFEFPNLDNMSLDSQTPKYQSRIKMVYGRLRRNNVPVHNSFQLQQSTLIKHDTAQEKNALSRNKSAPIFTKSNPHLSTPVKLAHEIRELTNTTNAPDNKLRLRLETREETEPAISRTKGPLHPQDEGNMTSSNVDNIFRTQQSDESFWTEERTELLTLKRANPIYDSDSDGEDYHLYESPSKRTRHSSNTVSTISSLSWSNHVPSGEFRLKINEQ